MGIQPATAINKNRNGSRTLGISIAHYYELRATDGSPCRSKQIQFSDHTTAIWDDGAGSAVRAGRQCLPGASKLWRLSCS